MLWAFGKRMGERDTKYAIKAGMATALLAAPAFFDSTRPVFLRYQGDWALISFFVVMSPTIGATNFMSFHRVLWTLCVFGSWCGVCGCMSDISAQNRGHHRCVDLHPLRGQRRRPRRVWILLLTSVLLLPCHKTCARECGAVRAVDV